MSWDPAPPSPSVPSPCSRQVQEEEEEEEEDVSSFSCTSSCFLPAPCWPSRTRPDPRAEPTLSQQGPMFSASSAHPLSGHPGAWSQPRVPLSHHLPSAGSPPAAQASSPTPRCPRADRCCAEKSLSWPPPRSVFMEQGHASWSQAHRWRGTAVFLLARTAFLPFFFPH